MGPRHLSGMIKQIILWGIACFRILHLSIISCYCQDMPTWNNTRSHTTSSGISKIANLVTRSRVAMHWRGNFLLRSLTVHWFHWSRYTYLYHMKIWTEVFPKTDSVFHWLLKLFVCWLFFLPTLVKAKATQACYSGTINTYRLSLPPEFSSPSTFTPITRP